MGVLCYNSLRIKLGKGVTLLTTTTDPARTSPTVLVLVTDQMSCERLIIAGNRLAKEKNLALEVLNICRAGSEPDPFAIEWLYRVSRENGAPMTVTYSEKPERTLIEQLRRKLPQVVVTGLPGPGSKLLPRLWIRFAQLDFYMVEPDGTPQAVTPLDRALA